MVLWPKLGNSPAPATQPPHIEITRDLTAARAGITRTPRRRGGGARVGYNRWRMSLMGKREKRSRGWESEN